MSKKNMDVINHKLLTECKHYKTSDMELYWKDEFINNADFLQEIVNVYALQYLRTVFVFQTMV